MKSIDSECLEEANSELKDKCILLQARIIDDTRKIEELTREVDRLTPQNTIREEVLESLNVWLKENKLRILAKHPELEKDSSFNDMRNITVLRYTIPEFDVVMMVKGKEI